MATWLDKAWDYTKEKGSQVGNWAQGRVDRIYNKQKDFFNSMAKGDLGGMWNAGWDLTWDVTNSLVGDLPRKAGDELMRILIPKPPAPTYEDRKITVRDTSAPRQLIYGRVHTGGVIRHIEASGTDNKYLHMIVVFATHSCAEIERVFVGDELAFVGNVAQGKFAGKAIIAREHGKQTGANPTIVANAPSITNDFKYLGCTYAYFRFEYAQDLYQGGEPQISAIIRGKDDIYDPRASSSGWTDNQALCIRDFYASRWGYNWTNFNEESFINGANICDQMVTTGAGKPMEKRYTVNGVFQVSGKPSSVIDAMDGAGLSKQVLVEGELYYIAGAYSAPVSGYSITDSDIWSGLKVTATGSASNRINVVRGTYVDINKNGEVVDFVPVSIPAYITQDKQELPLDAQFPCVSSPTHARRISKIALERSRIGPFVQATLSWRFSALNIGDRITFSSQTHSMLNGIVFRIESIEASMSGTEVQLQADSSSVWAWTEGDALVLPNGPKLNIPNGLSISAPTGFSAEEYLFKANDEKTVRNGITFVWDGNIAARNYELQGKFGSDPWFPINEYLASPTHDFNDPEVGLWQFRVRAVNSLGVVSAWATISLTTVGKTAPPANVSQFRGSIRPFGIELLWSPVADLDLDYYEIRLGNDWATATFLQRLQATRWQWETRPNGTENLLIKAYDTSGNESVSASAAELIIQQPASVNISPQVIDNNVLLRWTDATTSFSIDRYEVRRGAAYDMAQTVGTVRSTFANVFETEAGVYTYWIAAIDVAGNVGDPTSVVVNVDQPPDFTLLANQSIPLETGTAVNMITDLRVTEFTADSIEITADSMQWTADAANGVALVGPANTTETWAQHFEALPGWVKPYQASDTTWTADNITVTADASAQSIQELQIDDGYPIYLQPTPAYASYEVIVDMSGVIGLSRVRLAPDVDIVAGSPVLSWFIALSDDGVTYDELETLDRVGTNFRYVRIRIEIDSASGTDVARINDAILRLDVKLRTDQGTGVADDGDAGGTVVYFNVPFVDVQSIVLTPQGTTPAIMLYDFVDVPNPVSFKALAFDTAGNRITQPFSWTVRGV